MNPKSLSTPILCIVLREFACATMLLFAVTLIALGTADAQTFNVLYSFTGSTDGSQPWSGLIPVRGALYGTTFAGGNGDNGVVYMLSNSQSGLTTVMLTTVMFAAELNHT